MAFKNYFPVLEKKFLFTKSLAVTILEAGFSEAEVGDNNLFTFRKFEEDAGDETIVLTAISSTELDDGTSVFTCNICQHSSQDPNEVFLHLKSHEGEETPTVLEAVADNNQAEDNIADKPSSSNAGGNIHLDSQFMNKLKESFISDVVPTWSEKSRVACNQNQDLSDNPTKFKAIRKEITDSLVDHCIDKYGFEKPSLAQMRDLVDNMLAPNYEFMFSQKPGSASTIHALSFGRGFGGARGVDQLASQLWMSFYKKQEKQKKARIEAEAGSDTNDGSAGRPASLPRKKGRGKNYQGEWHFN